ncbi:isopenicillin N synthase family oxygenase [bacterium]|nr:isopenicillin N synthase family oxygenase [bacterium]
MTTEIQTLSVEDLRSNDPQKRKAFIDGLKTAYQDIGFVILKDHGITKELQDKAYQVIQDFFNLPVEEKMKYHIPGTGGIRGYTPFGTEHAKDNPVSDLKEFFHVGVEVPPEESISKSYPKNVSVEAVADFDSTLRNLYDSLLTLGMDVLKAISIILEIDEEFFTEKVRYGNSILRPIHYPPLKGDEKPAAYRASAHEDINLITLLIGASEKGLEVLTRQGEWLSVQSEPEEIVVNVGDMLQRLTNYKFISTTHRVVNPVKDAEKMKKPRFSTPFFLHPVSEMSLDALKTCVSESNPRKDPPTTAGEYLQERLREIGLTK